MRKSIAAGVRSFERSFGRGAGQWFAMLSIATILMNGRMEVSCGLSAAVVRALWPQAPAGASVTVPDPARELQDEYRNG